MNTIVRTSGAVVEIGIPPRSVVHHAWESSTEIHAFCEAENVVLAKDVAVNISTPDIYNDVAYLTPATIPAGTAVSSHLLHLDPVDTQRQALLIGSVTFNADILGVIVLNDDMDRSTETLGAPGIVYPIGELPKLTLDPQADVVEMASDRRTLIVQLDTRDTMDQIRVITAGCCSLESEGASGIERAEVRSDLDAAKTAHWFYTVPFPGVRYYSFEAPKASRSR